MEGNAAMVSCLENATFAIGLGKEAT